MGKHKYKELEHKWYKKLERSGFKDIEDHKMPGRPLKEWHSRKFCTDRSKFRQEARDNYNKRIDALVNCPEWTEICRLMAKHGNSSLSPMLIKKIIEFHREGKTEREIAKLIGRDKFCVHTTICKAREWMKIL